MLCFFISTLFSRANIAAAAGGVIFFCFYLPYSFLVVWEESLSSDFKIISVSLLRDHVLMTSARSRGGLKNWPILLTNSSG